MSDGKIAVDEQDSSDKVYKFVSKDQLKVLGIDAPDTLHSFTGAGEKFSICTDDPKNPTFIVSGMFNEDEFDKIVALFANNG